MISIRWWLALDDNQHQMRSSISMINQQSKAQSMLTGRQRVALEDAGLLEYKLYHQSAWSACGFVSVISISWVWSAQLSLLGSQAWFFVIATAWRIAPEQQHVLCNLVKIIQFLLKYITCQKCVFCVPVLRYVCIKITLGAVHDFVSEFWQHHSSSCSEVYVANPAWLWNSQPRVVTPLGLEKSRRINFSLGKWMFIDPNALKLMWAYAKG